MPVEAIHKLDNNEEDVAFVHLTDRGAVHDPVDESRSQRLRDFLMVVIWIGLV